VNTLASIPFPQIDPIAFHVGPLAVRWYGLAYLLAFALGYFLLRRFSARGILRVETAKVADLVGVLMLGVMVGGRAGWWLLYREQGAGEAWYEPIAIWHGGMSFHGGVAGVAVALLLWSRLNRAHVRNVADCLALVVPIGLFFGRIANFINAELVGRPTEVPWGVIFPGDTVARHPSQIYEAILEGPLLMMVLWLARRGLKLRDGQLAALFLAGYGVIRFAVEYTRQPDEQLGFIALGWVTMGQALSALLVVFGVVLWVFARKQTHSPARSDAPAGDVAPRRAA
jgi:phosphatidylglycerol---prolipoprotein diacylglyceryl transferase